jgi:hypothetical protein
VVSRRPFAVLILSGAGAEPAKAGELTLLNPGPRTLA